MRPNKKLTMEYRIASLWIKGNLSYLEQLCLLSFKHAGHDVTLYSYEPLGNVPEGIETADAADILPGANILQHRKTGSPALFANLFRYELMRKTDRTIWVDTDMYVRKPLQTTDGHCFGWESGDSINSAVLRLPRDSETLGLLREFTANEYPIPPWYPEKFKRKLQRAAEAGHPMHVGDLSWGVFGPQALTYFLQKTGESRYALAQGILYPFTYRQYKLPLKRNLDTSRWITPQTRAIHFYGKNIRQKLRKIRGGAPHPDSLLGQLLQQHGIDPGRTPVSPPKT